MAKICMVVFNNYSSDQRVRREAEALVKRGEEVDCICLNEDADKKRILKGVRLFYPPVRKYRGSSILLYLVQYLSFFLYAFFKLSALHLKKRYDVVQIHTMPDFLAFVALVPKLLGTKIILDVHDLVPELYKAKFGIPKETLLIRFLTWVERRSVAFADRAIAVHETHLGVLVAHGNPKEKFIVLLNVPDPEVFGRVGRTSQRSESDEFRLVYHGVITARAGIDVALRAANLARKEIPGLKFRIIGVDGSLAQYAKVADELQRDNVVETFGTVPSEELPALLANADVGILPYVRNEFTRHILPVKLMEYVAMGIPVISARLNTVEEYFSNDMVLYFAPGDERELARCIVELYKSPAKRVQLASNADLFLQTHNWVKAKESYFALIDSLVPLQ